jgi:hypothetical protein
MIFLILIFNNFYKNYFNNKNVGRFILLNSNINNLLDSS